MKNNTKKNNMNTEDFYLLLADQTGTAAQLLLNSEKINCEACVFADLADYLAQRKERKPLALVFDKRHAERVAQILKLVYFSSFGKPQTKFAVSVVILPDETLDAVDCCLNVEKVIEFLQGQSETKAATWLGCLAVYDFLNRLTGGADKKETLLFLVRNLRQIFYSTLFEFDTEAKENIFAELDKIGITTPQDRYFITSSLETELKEENQIETFLQVQPYYIQMGEFLVEGNVKAVKDISQRIFNACEGQGKENEKLFESPKDIDDYLAEMEQKRGLETGLNFKIEDSPEILPFELVEGVTLVCGARKHGKTTFLLNMLFNEAEKNLEAFDKGGDLKKVVFYSYEVTKPRIWQQFFSLYVQSVINRDKNLGFSDLKLKREISAFYEKKETSDEIIKQFHLRLKDLQTKFFNRYVKSGAIIVIADNLPAEELCRNIEAFCKKNICSLVGLDYIQELYSGLADIHKKSRVDELKYIGEQLRETANGLKIPLLAAAQFNRQIKTPLDIETLNIGEAGDLERNATAVIGLFNLKELKHIENREGDVNGVISALYKIGVNAEDIVELVPDMNMKEVNDKKRLKPCNGKLFCRLICSRFTEAPASVILSMDGKSGFIDIMQSEKYLKDLRSNILRLPLKDQLNQLQQPKMPEVTKPETKTPDTAKTKKEKLDILQASLDIK